MFERGFSADYDEKWEDAARSSGGRSKCGTPGPLTRIGESDRSAMSVGWDQTCIGHGLARLAMRSTPEFSPFSALLSEPVPAMRVVRSYVRGDHELIYLIMKEPS